MSSLQPPTDSDDFAVPKTQSLSEYVATLRSLYADKNFAAAVMSDASGLPPFVSTTVSRDLRRILSIGTKVVGDPDNRSLLLGDDDLLARIGVRSADVGAAEPTPREDQPQEEATYFSVIKPFPTNDDPASILFVRSKNGAPLPPAEAAFKRQINRAAQRVASAFREDKERRRELLGLLSIVAFNGLGGSTPILANGVDELDSFKALVADRANALKQARMYDVLQKCGAYAAVVVGSFILAMILRSVVYDYDLLKAPGGLQVLDFLDYAVPWLIGVSGVLLGFALMAFLLNRELTFDNFDRFEIYIVNVPYYVGYLVVLFSVVVALLAFDLVQLGLGGKLLNGFVKQPALGFLIGLSCAIGEQVYSQIVLRTLKPTERGETGGGDKAQ
jgi:hypothetical protein